MRKVTGALQATLACLCLVAASSCGGMVDAPGGDPTLDVSNNLVPTGACGNALYTWNSPWGALTAYSNGPNQGTGNYCWNTNYGLGYQCVELANRWVIHTLYHDSSQAMRIWGNAGSPMCSSAASLGQYYNVYYPGSSVQPQAGDILEWSYTHTAVVMDNWVDSSGQRWIGFIEQNEIWSSTETMVTYNVKWSGGSFASESCFIHPKILTAPPPPSCKPQPAFGTPSSCGGIAAGQGLKAGQSEWSCDGRFQFVMQGDGNLVLYSKYGVPMWASNTNGKGGAFAVMQGDGNLVIYTSAGCPVWASNTSGRSGTSLAVQGDGNVVLYQGSTAIWATNTGDLPPSPSGCGTIASGHGLIPGESESSCDGRFRLDMQGDGNLVLYQNGVGALWSSNTYRSAGRYAVMQGDGNFVVYPLGYKPAVWATGTYSHPGTWAAMQNDANFVLYQGSTPIWASNTCCR